LPAARLPIRRHIEDIGGDRAAVRMASIAAPRQAKYFADGRHHTATRAIPQKRWRYR